MLRNFEMSDLEFAFVYHVYFRWKTHRGKSIPALKLFDLPLFEGIDCSYDLHILQANTSESEVLLIASLHPKDSVSATISKLKGQTSKRLREVLGTGCPPKLLSRSYFACSVGRNTRKAVDGYLSIQAEHHGFDVSESSPVYIREMKEVEGISQRLQPKHARTLLKFHIVLSTNKRMRLFDRTMGAALSDFWANLSQTENWLIEKVTLLPDHVHLAISLHPAVSPAEMVIQLMNSSQEFLFNEFRDSVLSKKSSQVWNSGAYIGTYGDITSQAAQKYVREWESDMVDE